LNRKPDFEPITKNIMSKENKSNGKYHTCGKFGHFSRDYWHNNKLKNKHKSYLKYRKQHYKNTRNNLFKNKIFRKANKQINCDSSNNQNHNSDIFSKYYNLENDVLLNCIIIKYQNDSETKLEQNNKISSWILDFGASLHYIILIPSVPSKI